MTVEGHRLHVVIPIVLTNEKNGTLTSNWKSLEEARWPSG